MFHRALFPTGKGVFGGPSGPCREGPGVGHKIVSNTKQMTKERKKRKKNEWEKGKMCKEKKWKKEREVLRPLEVDWPSFKHV